MDKSWYQKGVSVWVIGLLVVSFGTGVFVALLAFRPESSAVTTFSTSELLGFFLTVILSGASIVLAISAIALGKLSEQEIVRRSDESISLQTEVFAKTTEALQRIESSTGVTEKRIEDIISGRVGDISHRLAQIASENGLSFKRNEKDLEEAIREAISQEIKTNLSDVSVSEPRTARVEGVRKRAAERKNQRQAYEGNHERLMLSLVNRDDMKVVKPPDHGSLGETGEDFFDAIFLHGDERIGVSTHPPGVYAPIMSAVAMNSAREVQAGTVDKVFQLIFDDPDLALEAAENSQALLPAMKSKIKFLSVPSESMESFARGFSA